MVLIFYSYVRVDHWPWTPSRMPFVLSHTLSSPGEAPTGAYNPFLFADLIADTTAGDSRSIFDLAPDPAPRPPPAAPAAPGLFGAPPGEPCCLTGPVFLPRSLSHCCIRGLLGPGARVVLPAVATAAGFFFPGGVVPGLGGGDPEAAGDLAGDLEPLRPGGLGLLLPAAAAGGMILLLLEAPFRDTAEAETGVREAAGLVREAAVGDLAVPGRRFGEMLLVVKPAPPLLPRAFAAARSPGLTPLSAAAPLFALPPLLLLPGAWPTPLLLWVAAAVACLVFVKSLSPRSRIMVVGVLVMTRDAPCSL